MAMEMNDPKQVMTALRGTALEGHEVQEGPSGTLVVEGPDSTAMLPLWRAAREAVPVTGRWPVMTDFEDLKPEPTPEEGAAFAAAAQTSDPWTIFGDPRGDYEAWQITDYLDACLGSGAGRRDDPRLTGITQGGLDRWVYEQMLADPALAARGMARAAQLSSTKNWYSDSDVRLVLLPTPAQWLAPQWLFYYGAERDRGPEALGAAILRWEQRWGAQLVASWGTMLQFLATRPPVDPEDAWQLAGELMTVGSSLQHERWELALALPHGDAWFVHCRP
ncbi:hypothetical protein Acy02nite_50190 [Actinoplanes cyaneus]|uniref:DUF4253 domain-containing protein n=1 Tax=Actinoplanes cyaneus TaxID=52696 RepID=A0A919IPG6_9ACTN|nr:DUF4253 domain-containing protein [Actinoplanes cyaneus]MCW2141076.1 protein of unknown function (DUF4253) [Actinoplanes cyaneus]GID67138.1 hypothetical protein Acy02nite_50190 [Actinoplanes cyaneus]